jgi:hypothetical protein
MESLKVYTADMSVKNSVGFCANTDHNILIALRQKFGGVCFMGAYILDITRVLKRSSCHIVNSNNSAYGNINIEFEARVIIFSRWDIVINARLNMVGQMLIAAAPAQPGRAADELIIAVKPAGKATESLQKNQILPLRLVTVLHSPMQRHVNCEAILLTCDKVAPYYAVSDDVDLSIYAELLQPLLQMVADELELRNSVMQNPAQLSRYVFFERLLFSYASNAPHIDSGVQTTATHTIIKNANAAISTWKGECPLPLTYNAPGFTPVNIIDLVGRAVAGEKTVMSGVWVRGLHLPRSSPLILNARGNGSGAAATANAVNNAIRMPSIDIVVSVLGNMRNFLAATRNMVHVYGAKEIDEHRNIWAVMRAAQMPLTLASPLTVNTVAAVAIKDGSDSSIKPASAL